MSIFFSSQARAQCKYCRNDLPGYSNSGHCPNCGRWYAVDRASIAPGRTRAVALLVRSHRASAQISNGWTGWAAGLFITGNALLVIVLGRMAIKALYHSTGM